MFHCPQCDKAWAVATPIRNHIISRCEGYVKYRHPSSTVSPRAKTRGRKVTLEEVKTEDVEYLKEGKHHELARSSLKEEGPRDCSIVVDTRDSCGYNPEPPISPTASNSWSPIVSRIRTPVLRPAVWSPGSTSSGSRASSRSPALVSASLKTESVSTRSSTSLVQTWLDKQLPGIQKKKNDHSQAPPQLFYSCSFSAAQIFLDGLRRPLGNAAPLLHGLGIVTKEDLDLICTMPNTWDELGDYLRKGGMTIIEWLMVKEAFKARVEGVSSSEPVNGDE